MTIELPYGQSMHYVPGFFAADIADQHLEDIHHQVSIEHLPNPMNRTQKIKRGNVWFADNPQRIYRYSGMELRPIPFPPILVAIGDRLRERFEPRLNSCLLNYYPDGAVGVAPHTDDDFPGCLADVVGVSYGATRLFRLTDKKTKALVHDIDLEHGSVLVMSHESQSYFKHEIVKGSKRLGPRLQLSWRVWEA